MFMTIIAISEIIIILQNTEFIEPAEMEDGWTDKMKKTDSQE